MWEGEKWRDVGQARYKTAQLPPTLIINLHSRIYCIYRILSIVFYLSYSCIDKALGMLDDQNTRSHNIPQPLSHNINKYSLELWLRKWALIKSGSILHRSSAHGVKMSHTSTQGNGSQKNNRKNRLIKQNQSRQQFALYTGNLLS